MKLLLLLVGLLLSCSVAKPPVMVPQVEIWLETTVTITSHCLGLGEDGEPRFIAVRGTGHIISKDRVLTADHVVTCGWEGEAVYSEIGMQDGTLYNAFLLGRGAGDVDAAVLEITGGDFKKYPIITAVKPTPGDTLCVASANPGPAWRYQCGKMISVRDGEGWAGLGSYTYSGQFIGGSSGSAIFNTSGEIVGIHVGGNHYMGYGLGYFVESFRDLLTLP